MPVHVENAAHGQAVDFLLVAAFVVEMLAIVFRHHGTTRIFSTFLEIPPMTCRLSCKSEQAPRPGFGRFPSKAGDTH